MSGYGFEDSKVSKKLCCKSGRCIYPATVGMKLPMKAKCNGDVAMDWHRRMGLRSQEPASVVEEFALEILATVLTFFRRKKHT